jgi:hypothetical protein
MQAHFSTHIFESPGQKRRVFRPGFNRSERMLYRLLSDQHAIWHFDHLVIHSINLILMFPTRDPALSFTFSALRFQTAGPAGHDVQEVLLYG